MTWWNIYKRHTEGRGNAEALLRKVRPVLQDLRVRAHLPPGFDARWSPETNQETGTAEWYMNGHQDGALSLPNTVELKDVKLTLLGLVDTRANRLRQFTAMLEGARAADNTPWVVAVHLEDAGPGGEGDQKGTGACGHAAWHCHVGPDLSAKPKARVPLPALKPADALRWVLTAVMPSMEPAPWDQRPQ